MIRAAMALRGSFGDDRACFELWDNGADGPKYDARKALRQWDSLANVQHVTVKSLYYMAVDEFKFSHDGAANRWKNT
jgi:hypothetical protein